ncbi:MAG TPA: linear amide C-N hydrolase [Segetibacter sp.]|nr:linear amide C-N hydrolase [Segetibacter sp.]
MKKIFGIIILFSFTLIQVTRACTTFFLTKDGQMVFGKNYDWMTGTGAVNTNLRGLAKSSLPLDGGNIIQWTSKYGSTTFNQYGKEFPNGGMNEKGLVVELMWLSESEYPNKDKRPGLSVLQWIQYQLDNAATVEEVIATDELIRVTSTGTPQHYLVADSKGGVATIEFLHGEMVVHRGDKLPYPVLANSTYESSVKTFKNNKNFEDNNSVDRFSKACSMVEQYQKTNNNKPLVDYSFEILNNVAQPGYTKWSIVYDITKKKIYFKTNSYQQLKSFSLKDFNYSCSSQPLLYDMAKNDKGDISGRFVAFRNDQNKKMLKEAFKESSGSVNIGEALQNSVADFAAAVGCK